MNPLDLEAALASLREEAREQRYSQFDLELLVWLVLVPEWTSELATALGLGSQKRVAALVDQLATAGLIDRSRQQSFSLRPAERAGLVTYLKSGGQAVAARALTRLTEALERVPDAGPAWRQPLLDVGRYRSDPSGLGIMSALDRLIAQGRLDEAGTLVDTAQAAGDLIGGTLDATATRAQWRLRRAHRDNEDRDYLLRYLSRVPVEGAINALLGDREQWALHLMGAGGAGKTMVLRYLVSGSFAEAWGRPLFPVARIDFDYLDPQYPERRPAELLLWLADELLGYGQTRDFAAYYQRLRDTAAHLHEEASRAGSETAALTGLTRQTVVQFARLLDELPDPVLLVLDTFEEIAKLYAPGAPAPGIDHAFGMMELLHEVQPKVRVVFSGRRPLVPGSDPRQAAAGPLLRPRPYLRVFDMPGFNAAEADAYVDMRAPGIAPAVRSALMDRVRDTSGWYNPFELNAYCEWALAEPGLDPGLLRDYASDPYVERRILARLDDEVRAALPVAVAFGSFTRALAEPALTRLGIDADRAFDRLAAEEWVIVREVDARGLPATLELDPHLRDRLYAVVSPRTKIDVARLGADAASLADQTPLAQLATEVVEAAVRLSPPREASALWRRLERRVVEERAWDWAAAVVPRAGAALAGPAEQTILAAVLATQASVRLHADPHASQGTPWRSVWQELARYPDAENAGKRALAGRAVAGLMRAGEQVDQLQLADAPEDAAVAAAEAIQARGAPLPPALAGRLARTDPGTPADLGAARQLALAWDHMSAGRGDAAVVAIHVALAALRRSPVTAGSYADWIPPADLGNRCLLAELVIAAESGREPALVTSPQELRLALESARAIDGERLASLAIDLLARRGPVEPNLLIEAEAADRYVSGRRPDSWVHRMTRPLVVAIAEAWSVHGKPDRAAGLLRERIDVAVSAGGDAFTVDACQLALLRLCRRYRTTVFAGSVHRLAEEGSREVRAEAWLVRTLIRGERPSDAAQAGSFFGWWRCLDVTAGLPVSAGPVSEPGLPAAGGAANAREFETLAGRPASVSLPEEPILRVLPETLAEVLRFHAVASSRLRGRYPGLPPFLFGRAALEAGEVLALHLSAQAAPLLRAAAGDLRACGDRLGAAQADVLAALAERRLGSQDAASAAVPGADLLAVPDWGWDERVRALRGGRSEPWSASPEIPQASGTQEQEPRASVWAKLAATWQTVVRRNPFPGSVTVAVDPVGEGAMVWVRKDDGITELVDPEQAPGRLVPIGAGNATGRWQVVQLEIDQTAEQYPWEQLLDYGRDLATVLPFRREPGAWWPFGRLAWLRHASYRRQSVTGVAGTPVEAYGGARWRVSNQIQTQIQAASRLNVASLVRSRPVVVILQADPVDGPPRPLGDLRAGFMRQARSVLDSGANAVLVVPPLPDSLAIEVGVLANRRLVRRLTPPRPRHLLRLLGDLKKLTADTGADRDAILDILLFLHTHD